MAVRKAHRISARRAPSSARLVFTFFMLLSFALQSYVMQTHIHTAGLSVTAGLTTIFKSDGAGKHFATKGAPQPRDDFPANDDPSNCPLCQEILHSGQFVTPSTVVLVLPAQTISFVPINLVLPLFSDAVSHNWQGRAPPRI
jgi:DUF2946 family protein